MSEYWREHPSIEGLVLGSKGTLKYKGSLERPFDSTIELNGKEYNTGELFLESFVKRPFPESEVVYCHSKRNFEIGNLSWSLPSRVYAYCKVGSSKSCYETPQVDSEKYSDEFLAEVLGIRARITLADLKTIVAMTIKQMPVGDIARFVGISELSIRKYQKKAFEYGKQPKPKNNKKKLLHANLAKNFISDIKPQVSDFKSYLRTIQIGTECEKVACQNIMEEFHAQLECLISIYKDQLKNVSLARFQENGTENQDSHSEFGETV